jgi:head-tail adaptor
MTGGAGRAPTLARRLVLEERVTLPDGSGGFATAWQTRGALWADVAARSGREDFVAAQARPRVRYRILVRGAPVGSPSRPRPDQRFREGERVFNILTVAEADPAGRFLEITAEEGVLP